MSFDAAKSEQGDLTFNFDPEKFDPDLQRSIDQDTARVGVRYSPWPNSSFLMSYIFSDLLDQQDFPDFRGSAEDKGSQVESQYIYTGDWINLIVGLSRTDVNRTLEATGQGQALQELQHLHPYVYTNLKFPSPVTWTLGVSYDDFENDPVEVKTINPKFGVRWDITSDLSIRAAAFRWVKPPLIADRALEPTQVSGFNQFFDNSNGDDAWRRGVGVDWRLTNQLFAGAEATWRDINVPINEITTATFETWKEQLHLAYLFWTLTPRISLSGQVVYDTFESEKGVLTDLSSTPENLKTFSIPLGARYFDPSGFFAGVFWTYVNQETVRSPTALSLGFSDGKSDFFVVDASVGWRFPKRLGIASLTVNNLFNQKFLYQDDSFREFRDEPSASPFVPERQVVARATLYF